MSGNDTVVSFDDTENGASNVEYAGPDFAINPDNDFDGGIGDDTTGAGGDIDDAGGGGDRADTGNRFDGYVRNTDGSVKRNKDGSPRKKRGRKAGVSAIGSTKTSSKGAVNLGGVEAILLSIHEMAAAAMHTPELRLESDEANGMAKAIAEVAKHYPTKVDPKTLAWVNLIMAVSVVYFPRIYLIRERHKSEKAENVAKSPVTFTSPIVNHPEAQPFASPVNPTQNAGDIPFVVPAGSTMAGLDDNYGWVA
jgi:hypothetical protein